MADIEAVCVEVGRQVRSEGESAFPPIAILEVRLGRLMHYRQQRADTEAELARIAELKAERERNPENFVTTASQQADIDRLNAKLSMTANRGRAVPRYTAEQEAALERLRDRVVTGTEEAA